MAQSSAAKAARAAAAGAGGGYAVPNLSGMSKDQLAGIFGERIAPVDYTPLEQKDPGYRATAGRVIAGNQKNLPKASKLSADTNLAISKAAKTRAEGWDPTLMASLSQLYQNRNNALAGNVPYTDAMRAMAGRARQANDMGNAGGSGRQTAADLGLMQMDIQAQGAQLAGTIQQILNGIDPVARHTTPESYQVNVGQAIQTTVMDNQFSAQFEAQQNAIRAMADPVQAGLYNQKMFMAGLSGQRGGMPMPQGPNAMQMIGAIGGSLGQVAGAFSAQPQRGNANLGVVDTYSNGSYADTPRNIAAAQNGSLRLPTFNAQGRPAGI